MAEIDRHGHASWASRKEDILGYRCGVGNLLMGVDISNVTAEMGEKSDRRYHIK